MSVAPSYTFITRQHQLDLAVSQLSGVKQMAVDTESSGYYTYYSELCLIQISSGQYHYIIDTLAGLKLNTLGGLFSNPSITKLFHSASSDIIEMKRVSNWNFVNIFDTFLACRMLGHESCSLASLVKHYMDITMKKNEQKSNWKKRPLTRSQLDYAHLDTAYLEELVSKMESDLEKAGLTEEYRQEVEWMLKDQVVPEKQFDPDGWIHIPGALSLEPGQRGCLKSLYELRDQRARKLNIAPFRLVTNRSLLDMCRDVPTTPEAMEKKQLINPRHLQREAGRFIHAIENAPEIHDHELPVSDELDSVTEESLKLLKRWRYRVASERRMDASVILNNRALTRIALSLPETMEDLSRLEVMTPHKLKNYGAQILQVLKKRSDMESSVRK